MAVSRKPKSKFVPIVVFCAGSALIADGLEKRDDHHAIIKPTKEHTEQRPVKPPPVQRRPLTTTSTSVDMSADFRALIKGL